MSPYRAPVVLLSLGLALSLAPPLVGSTAPAADPAAADTTDLPERLDTHLSRLAGLGFSGAVVVARGEEVVLEKGFGLADREAGRAWTAGTPSTIGSITKPLTATAVLTLVEAGRLGLDDPLPRFFDDVPADKAGITVRHLLTHTAGFPGAIGSDFEPVERDPFVRQALDTPLSFAPGERYDYSNVGYSLLGAIIEIVTGQGYEAYLRDAVLSPAGMGSTGYELADTTAGLAAVGYRDGERWGTVLERPWASDGPGWHLRANGGIHSTVGDLRRFDRALAEGRILSPAWRDSMQVPRVPEGPQGRSHYGFGWAIFELPRGATLVAHNGGNGIFAADLRRYVDEDVLVAALSNVAEWSAIEVTPVVARLIQGDEVPLPPEVTAVAPAAVEGMAGAYELPGGGEVRIETRGGRLVAIPVGGAGLRALAGGDADRLEALGARALAAVRAADEGDYAPVAGLFGGALSEEEVRSEETAMRSRLEENLGPRVDTRLVGTAILGGRPTTVLELVHERGSRYLDLVWSDERVAGIGVGESPPEFVLHLASPTEAFAFDLREGVVLRVVFEDSKDGPAGAVTFQSGESGVVRGVRSSP